MSLEPKTFRESVGCGCLIAMGLFALLLLLGKIAQWTGAA